MSLMFGLFSKGTLPDVSAAKDAFCHHGKRKSHSFVFRNAQISYTEGRASYHQRGDVHAICTGDILNRDRFFSAKDDSEFIIRFMQEMPQRIGELEGIFAFALYDEKKRSLLLANDGFGLYPLFIYEGKGYIAFSSEFQSLLYLPHFRKSLDLDSAKKLLIYGALAGHQTLFEAIENLEGASIIRCNIKNIKDSYKVSDNYRSGQDIEYYSSRLRALVRSRVKEYLRRYPDSRCQLSGGVDTRLILSLMPENERRRREFIFINRIPIPASKEKDVVIAKMIAKRFGLSYSVERLPLQFRKKASLFESMRYGGEDMLMTGINGGQYLGGDSFREVEMKSDRIVRYRIFLINPIKVSLVSRRIALLAFSRSFLSELYGACPGFVMSHAMHYRNLSPYIDTEIIKIILKTPEEYFYNYGLDHAVHSFPENPLLDIPTNSITSRVKGSPYKFLKSGLDRKFYSQGSTPLNLGPLPAELRKDLYIRLMRDRILDRSIALSLKYIYIRKKRVIPVDEGKIFSKRRGIVNTLIRQLKNREENYYLVQSARERLALLSLFCTAYLD